MVGPQPSNQFVSAFLRGLTDLGYVYGEHYVTEPRGAESKAERYPGFVDELLHLKVDVIVAVPAALPALKRATSTVPVVMTGSPDPVGHGFAQSLGRPGGNFTGLSNLSFELTGKRLELLREMVPGSSPIAVLWEQATLESWQVASAAAAARAWPLLSIEIRDVGRVEDAFRAATAARSGALLVTANVLLGGHGRRLAELAIKSRLPTMY
jgi:putative tryptophan/tyrosine transport system substrate-binding protein